MTIKGHSRKPGAFRLEPEPARSAQRAKPAAERSSSKVEFTSFPDNPPAETARINAPVPDLGHRAPGLRWGMILISALGAMLSFGVGLAITGIIEDLFARHAWLGWAGLTLTAIAGAAALVLAGRELAALMRQRRITHISEQAAQALKSSDPDAARKAQDQLIRLYQHRQELIWPLQRLGEHDQDILDPTDRLALVERELMALLDREAKALIMTAAKRVSVLTALSPSAIVDISFVAAVNLRLMRALAELYGGRPGFFGLARLARMVLTHLTLTGGIALGDDMIQQLLGHSLASRISSRLGEGVLNGAMTARIGLAAMQICRPMPFRALQLPGLKGLVGSLLSGSGRKGVKKHKPS